MSDLAETTRSAQRYAEAWSSQDPESVAAFFAANGSLSVNDGPPAVGRTAIAEVARGFIRDLPDIVVMMDRMEQSSIGHSRARTPVPEERENEFASADTNFGGSIMTGSSQNRKGASTARSTNARSSLASTVSCR